MPETGDEGGVWQSRVFRSCVFPPRSGMRVCVCCSAFYGRRLPATQRNTTRAETLPDHIVHTAQPLRIQTPAHAIPYQSTLPRPPPFLPSHPPQPHPPAHSLLLPLAAASLTLSSASSLFSCCCPSPPSPGGASAPWRRSDSFRQLSCPPSASRCCCALRLAEEMEVRA